MNASGSVTCLPLRSGGANSSLRTGLALLNSLRSSSWTSSLQLLCGDRALGCASSMQWLLARACTLQQSWPMCVRQCWRPNGKSCGKVAALTTPPSLLIAGPAFTHVPCVPGEALRPALIYAPGARGDRAFHFHTPGAGGDRAYPCHTPRAGGGGDADLQGRRLRWRAIDHRGAIPLPSCAPLLQPSLLLPFPLIRTRPPTLSSSTTTGHSSEGRSTPQAMAAAA
jgi:hypothetical protein